METFREGGLAALIQTREQRSVMARLQAAMAVIEGHSEHVMDSLGERLIPDLATLRAAMARRRGTRSAPERVVERLLGLDLKLAQYELGKSFCDAVVERGGMEALDAVWSEPAALPDPARAERSARLARTSRAARSGLDPPRLFDRNLRTAAVYKRVFDGIFLLNLELISIPNTPNAGVGESQMATQTEQQRKATAQKAAATRRRNAAKRSQSARKAAATRAQAELSTAAAVQAQAERAVLIPVGAALVARDTLLEAAKPYVDGRESAEKELGKLQKRVSTNLRKFERRGTTARNRALREVKRTRTRFERELRQRRTKAVRTVKGVRKDAGRQVKVTGREAQRQAEGLAQRVAPSPRASTSPRPVGETGTGVRLPAKPGSAVSLLPQSMAPFGAPSAFVGGGIPGRDRLGSASWG